MKKRKIFKTLAFSSLALVMAAGGIFAFAPIGANASTPSPTTTTGLGLDPKNDPVVYTTESGLEIRMSNANKFSGTVTTTTNTGYTHTQDLRSFYYLTMGAYSGKIYTGEGGSTTASYTCTNEPVNWIILGVGSHSNAFVESVSNYLFSTIKNNDYLFSNGEYYFDNQHETYSPAGQLIDSAVSTKTYLMGKVKDSIKVHTDIPKGCMLVLSEKLLGQTYFNATGDINYNIVGSSASTGGYYLQSITNYGDGNRYRYYGDIDTSTNGAQTWNNQTDGSLYTYINSLFSKNKSTGAIEGENKLGFTKEQADAIVPQQLYTFYSNGDGYPLAETPSTDGGTYYTMFPLALRAAHSTTKQNFCIEDYFSTSAQRVATFIGSNQPTYWWLRSGFPTETHSVYSVYTPGNYNLLWARDTQGVRPAMVMKLQ